MECKRTFLKPVHTAFLGDIVVVLLPQSIMVLKEIGKKDKEKFVLFKLIMIVIIINNYHDRTLFV